MPRSKSEHNKISKVLIANRGEIARRIQRTCTDLGIKTTTCVSEVDRKALFAREAEEIALLKGVRSYLDIDEIVITAKKYKCDAIHPGYGFLSENSHFSRKVRDQGLILIGPSTKAIEIMGSKTAAREAVSRNSVPILPGTEGGLSDQELIKRSKKIGFPLLIKAVGGGGGRGMRVAQNIKELKELLPRVRGEVRASFGSDDVFLEKYLVNPRHIEVQVFGDSHGNIVHLGTRECSTQRRKQKLVEEAPAPSLSEKVREKIQAAAVMAAKSVSYENAGTVEFLFSKEAFYFLEMNTRIQVEHPVTEEVFGYDLIEAQIRVAEGKPLPFKQKDIKPLCHSIEFRINAEDPENNFVPTTGEILSIKFPSQKGVRIDFGFGEGDTISTSYDGLIGKIIVTDRDRSSAIKLAREALRDLQISGIQTNTHFHRWLIRCSPFVRQPIDIGFVEREFNRKCLDDLVASDRRDPAHRGLIEGKEFKEEVHYKSKKFSYQYKINLIHKTDGTFMVKPLGLKGEVPKPKHCRISNGKQAALKALIEDVLEIHPPKEVWEKRP